MDLQEQQMLTVFTVVTQHLIVQNWKIMWLQDLQI